MSATRQPYGSIPSTPFAEGDNQEPAEDGDEWQAALTRARRQTYEGPEPASATHWEDKIVSAGPVIRPEPGHALRVHEQAAWAPPVTKPNSSMGTIIVTSLVVGALATGAWLWQQQEHTRLMRAKDQQLQRMEAQKSAAQEARAEVENTLAVERAKHAAALQALRAERNAALNAAAPNAAASAPIAEPEAAKPAAPLPTFNKKQLDNDPLGGLTEAAGAPKISAKTRKR